MGIFIYHAALLRSDGFDVNSWNILLLHQSRSHATVSLSSNAYPRVGKVPKEMTPEWSRRLSAPNRRFKWNTACLG